MQKILSKSSKYIIAGIVLIVLMAGIEFAMGRVPMCTCGVVKLWHGVVQSSGNSQHLTDWYTFSHILHGLAFYFILWVVDRKKRLSFAAKVLIAIAIECGWEVFENSSLIINRYRAATISLDYYGDSIINSISDVLAMIAGFFYARKFPVWASIVLVAVFELVTLYFIRDNLVLNIIMLIYPLEAIRAWQAQG